jgi:inner membrane protein
MEDVIKTESSALWQKSKLLIKGLIIGVLVLLLLIPAYFVQNLIKEREQRQKEAVVEVSSKWAGRQIITGPVMVLPYWQKESDTTKGFNHVKHFAYFLPDRLDINATVTPQEKHRGIYKVMLYNSVTRLNGSFVTPNLSILNISPEQVIWNEAFVKIHVSDAKGLSSELLLKWKDSTLTMSPSIADDRHSAGSLGAMLAVQQPDDVKNVNFSIDINLNGSEKLLYTPVGKSTTVNLNSTWSHPSFTGNTLPQTTAVSDSGFTATWNSLSHTRGYPQQWKDDSYSIIDFFPESTSGTVDYAASGPSTAYTITASAFGTDLFVPVNGYQKTMRSVKYAILCILLTFTGFFLIETTNKRSVHPVQYALIGFALILFYTLLLSFSEYAGFNTAYGIAAIATVGLITWFVKGLLGSMRLSLLLSFVLILLYSYVFTILQLQDYALILGSIGLFLTLAVVMYYSKKIQW